MAQGYDPSTQEDGGRKMGVPDQPELQNEFKASLDYIRRPYVKKPRAKQIAQG